MYGSGKEKSMTLKWIGSKPVDCELCNQPYKDYFIDGVTDYGSWAMMCIECHKKQKYGGLGMGFGQKYNLQTLEKVEG